MDEKLKLAKNILKKYNQEHLLNFYDEITEKQKNKLISQISKINFEKILNIYDKSVNAKNNDKFDITPLLHYEKNTLSNISINNYTHLGEEIIKNNELAIVTMAGGQGTRLGYKGPKGTYILKLEPLEKSLFQIIAEDILETNRKYNITISWYIMTSQENDMPTKEFFEMNNFFDYPKEKITFFTQDKLPIITTDGKLILQEPYLIKEASNGNGNVFKSMKKHHIIDKLENDGIKWISFGGIDNILLKNADPFFLGMVAGKNLKIGSKSIFKKEPLEKTAVYCRKNGKISILDYDDITLELSESKLPNTDIYLYREANMLSHIMNISAVKKSSEIDLIYHRAFKKNTFINYEGVKEIPDKPNTFKFENFIFDVFSEFDDMLLLRVDEDEEFAPIKDFTSKYNPDSAIKKYKDFKEKKTNN